MTQRLLFVGLKATSYMKLNTDKCHLLVSGNKNAQDKVMIRFGKVTPLNY